LSLAIAGLFHFYHSAGSSALPLRDNIQELAELGGATEPLRAGAGNQAGSSDRHVGGELYVSGRAVRFASNDGQVRLLWSPITYANLLKIIVWARVKHFAVASSLYSKATWRKQNGEINYGNRGHSLVSEHGRYGRASATARITICTNLARQASQRAIVIGSRG
jgi:hypothetical protein